MKKMFVRCTPLGMMVLAGSALSGCASSDEVTAEYAVPSEPTPVYVATRDPSHPTSVPYDPFLISGGVMPADPWQRGKPVGHGDGIASTDMIRLNPVHPPKTQPSNGAMNLYGELMASAIDGKASGQASRGGGANFSQVSFATEGSDFDPVVSRDGTQVVFASTQHRPTADIYIKSLNGRTIRQLTSDPSNDVMPAISPDGERLAYASNRGGNWDIFVMPTAGGRSLQITNAGSDDLHPSWSPDGQKLVFCRMGEVSGQWELWVAEVFNSGASTFIGFGMFPEWCPTGGTGESGGDRILFQRSRERGDRAFGIWTLDYQEGQASNATELASLAEAACINPTWSPDGAWIAYATVGNPNDWARSTSSRPNTGDLWMMDVNGGTRLKLTSGEALNLMPTWAANNTLVFVSDRGGVDNLWSMNLGGAVQLATGPSSAGKLKGMTVPSAYAKTPVEKKPAKQEAMANASEASSDDDQ
jgi:TolB protein